MSDDETRVMPPGGDDPDRPQGSASGPAGSEEETRAWDPEETRVAPPEMLSGPPPGAPTHIGRYKILGQLGEGGMGVVYEAQQQNPNRRVALKVVRGGHFVDETLVRMFQREAETLGRLKHPNIGAIYESGRTEDGQHFFAMELVRGETLDDYLAKRGQRITPEELEHRLRLFRQIADAVHYAHQRGVIHRDLKPGNIVVSDSAHDNSSISGVRATEIKILDFGLARITEEDIQATSMSTQVGMIKGTLPYMSPEQARGNPAEIDVRTDVYALGVILYEMLTGRRPYDTQTSSLVEAVRIICEQTPEPLRQNWSGTRKLDPDVATIVNKSLEKDVDDRYDSAAAMSEDVHRYLTSQPILARPPSTIYQIKKLVARNKLGAAFAATVLLLLVGFGIWMSVLWQQSEQARLRAEASNLVTLGRALLDEAPSATLGYAIHALERSDIQAARLLALQALWRGPTARVLDEVPVMPSDWSSDGRFIATNWANFETRTGNVVLVSSDGTISEPLASYGAPNSYVGISPDAKRVASIFYGENVLRVYDVESGQQVREVDLEGPSNGFNAGTTARFFTATQLTEDLARIRSWPFGDGEPQEAGTLPARFFPDYSGVAVAISNDGESIAFWQQGDIVLQRLDEFGSANARKVRRHESPAAVAFSPDGSKVISVNQDAARLWRLDGTADQDFREFPTEGWNRAAIDPSGRYFALSKADGLAQVWDLEAPPDASPMTLARKDRQVIFALTFHPQQPWLAVGDNGGGALWWLATPRALVLEGHEEPVQSLDFSPDGSFLVSSSSGELARFWPLSGSAHGQQIGTAGRRIDISPDGLSILGAWENGGAGVVSLEVARNQWTTGDPFMPLHKATPNFEGWSAAWSPDSTLVAACGGQFDPASAMIKIWSPTTGDLRDLDVGDGQPVVDCLFLDNDRVFGAGPGGIRLWDRGTGEHEIVFEGPSSYLALTPDGRSLLSIGVGALFSQGDVLRIHDLETGDVRELPSHGNLVNHVAVDSTGARIATGDITGTVRLGRVTGEAPHLFLGHEGVVHAVAFDPNGRWLASAGLDSDVRLWPILEGTPFHTRPLDEVLETLRSLTNYRVVADPSAPSGYDVEAGPFPGWESTPRW